MNVSFGSLELPGTGSYTQKEFAQNLLAAASANGSAPAQPVAKKS